MKLSHYLLIAFLTAASISLFGQNRQQDSLSLVSFYNATCGEYWLNNSSWLTGVPIRSWFGVSLSQSTNRVYRISLNGNNLVGAFPEAIGSMDALSEIRLSGNNLTGAVPGVISDLPVLNKLDIGNNKLRGYLPNLSGIATLRELTINYNKFTFEDLLRSGVFPNDLDLFEYAPQDTVLALKRDVSDGTISVEIADDEQNTYKWFIDGDWVNTSSRVVISMWEGDYSCEVTNSIYPDLVLYSDTFQLSYSNETDSIALVRLFNLTNGQKWINSDNWLTGNIDSWYGVKTDADGRVVEINLSDNNLVGTLPDEIANLTHLADLRIDGNKVRGDLPLLRRISTLDTIELQHNHFFFADLRSSELLPEDINWFIYQPQDTVLELRYDLLESFITLHDKADTNNVYSWYMNDLLSDDSARTIRAFSEGLYNCVVTNPLFADLSLYSDTLSVQFSLVTDSIALAHLYKETNGDQWANHLNWLTGPVNSWYGVVLDGENRVSKVLLARNKLSGEIPAIIGNLPHLTQINLSSNQLVGEIPTEIESLTILNSLKLFNNQLTGEIPTGIGKLTGLTILELNSNQLEGDIPLEISSLSELTSLKLSNNKFTGSIPPGIGELTKLTWLAMNYNLLEGSIPSEIGNLEYLAGLELAGNSLSGSIPTAIGNLSGLIRLSLNDNKLTGDIPAVIGQLSNLNYLCLSDNNLSGTIPSSLMDLDGLTSLLLSHNQLSGAVPDGISFLTNLTEIDLSANQLSDTLPAGFNNLTALFSLNLDNNRFVGDLPNLSDASYLEEITIENNQFTFSNLMASEVLPANADWFTYSPQDTVWGVSYTPETTSLTVVDDHALSNQFVWFRDSVQLEGISSTIYLTLEGNYYCKVSNPIYPDLEIQSDTFLYTYSLFTDSLALVALYNSTNGDSWAVNTGWKTGPLNTWYGITMSGGRVNKIELNGNGLVGILPSEIGNLTHLSVLQLQNNNLNGQLPVEIGAMDSLTDLRLNNNLFSGELIPELANLLKMKTLYLNNNQFSGSIPETMGRLGELTYLTLSNNQLSGALPVSLGNLKKLQTLNLSNNQFAGGLPAEMGDMSALQTVYLQNNQFSGSLPRSLGSLLVVKTINVSGNNFEGELPSELGNLDNLLALNIGGNNFSGNIPSDMSYLSSLNSLNISNNAFCFVDIEPLLDWDNYTRFQSSFIYSSQAKVGKTATVAGYIGAPLLISIEGYEPSSNDHYQWYKDDVLLNNEEDSVLFIVSFSSADAGAYHCVITNGILANLTLISYDVAVAEYSLPVNRDVAGVTIGNGENACFDAIQQITVAGGGETVGFFNGSSVTLIAGESIRLLPGFYAWQGSNVRAYITENGAFCEPELSGAVYARLSEKSENVQLSEHRDFNGNINLLKVYPNPNDGRFIIELPGHIEMGAKMRIVDMQGQVVYSTINDGNDISEVTLSNVCKGIFFVMVDDGNNHLRQKFIVR